MSEQSQFLFAVCQRGAEPALKSEVARMERGFRFAYSRPGFVTFRLPDDRVWGADLDFHSVFARAHGLTIGKVEGTDAGALAANVWTQLEDRQVRQLHVWQRDRGLPGDRGCQPGYGQAVDAAVPALQGCLPDGSSVNINQTARPGDEVFDCILVEPHVWWLGHHIARGAASRWPGGVYAESRPADAVSRAYIKTNEALTWSRISLSAGDRCVEIGSAPGGSSQALLEQGLQVIGIDPAEMDARVLQHPAFSHIRKRGSRCAASRFSRCSLADGGRERRTGLRTGYGRGHCDSSRRSHSGYVADVETARLETGRPAAGLPAADPFVGVPVRAGTSTGPWASGNLRVCAAPALNAPTAAEAVAGLTQIFRCAVFARRTE